MLYFIAGGSTNFQNDHQQPYLQPLFMNSIDMKLPLIEIVYHKS